MNTLLLIGLGPVQEFIARARRMRDLWMGSHLLSEMSRAAARSLADEGWTLIFPGFDRADEDLELCPGMWRDSGVRPLSVVNKVLAARPDIDDEAAVASAARARSSAVAAWKEFALGAIKRGQSLLRDDLPEIYAPEGVIEDALEFVAAWSTYRDQRDYSSALEEAERRLASRKLLRDFPRWEGRNLPKSSLDGFRETILKDGAQKEPAARRFRLGDGEHLDGIGVVKRMGGEPDQFVPVSRVALAPWIDRLIQRERAIRNHPAAAPDKISESWHRLTEACKLMRVSGCDLRAAGWMPREFPYDGEIFLEGQWSSLTFDDRLPRSREEDRALGVRFGQELVRPLLQRLTERGGAPHPYVACLVADGDRMGRAIVSLGNSDRHLQFSKRLAQFARKARDIVEGNNRFGILVYSGGDDIAAFLPTLTAVSCAAALHEAFTQAMAECFERTEQAPTLSIGIGIAHVLTPLGELIELARRAEKLAKEGDDLLEAESRNALAVIVQKRSGGQTTWRSSWSDAPLERLDALTALFEQRRIPWKLPYEFEGVQQRFPAEEGERNSLFWAQCLTRDLTAILRRKRPTQIRTEGLNLNDIGLSLGKGEPTYGEVVERTQEWVALAKIASTIADAQHAVEAISDAGKGD